LYVGPDPGLEGHGYYPLLTDNIAILNTNGGIASAFPHGVIRGNSVFQNLNEGISLKFWANNTTTSQNYISENPIGMMIPDSLANLSITGNMIGSEAGSPIFIRSGSGAGDGTIYDNIISGDAPVSGNGTIGVFSWTNPAGPVPGTSIMDGPYVAGNYWTNENETGWSDLQPGNPAGYTHTPYPVAPGVNDTAPLVRVEGTPTPTVTPTITPTPVPTGSGSVIISSSANNWGIIVPKGNHTYPKQSDASYITQAKPGAYLAEVIVDTESVGPQSSWTFTNLTGDHSIEAVGEPKPGQMIVLFNATPRSGQVPLTVQFADQSAGFPEAWLWEFGDGAVNSTSHPQHTYTTPGVYTVTLKAMNANTGGYCQWERCITVTERPVQT